MNQYSATFALTLNASVADIAAKIGKAFDPDSGGENSFVDNGDGTISTSTPCTPEFKQEAELAMTDANILFQGVQAKYAERWAELTPPTLAECEQFIDAIIMDIQNG